MAGHEQAAVEAGAQLAGRQPSQGLQVEPVDNVLERPIQQAGVLERHLTGTKATKRRELPRPQQIIFAAAVVFAFAAAVVRRQIIFAAAVGRQPVEQPV